jgi:DNA-binding NtrC family response regulator
MAEARRVHDWGEHEDAPNAWPGPRSRLPDERIVAVRVSRWAAIAQSNAALLLHGESGAGKKTWARRFHDASPRRHGPFVVVPCGDLSDVVLDAERRELAGGCVAGRRDAWFHAAEGGTLVLDRLEDLPLDVQGALIRVLSDPSSAARPGVGWQPRGVRVMATTREDLAVRAASGEMLEGLYFRIAAFVIEVPPLRARRDELFPLVDEILARSPASPERASLGASARAALMDYPFPGNVAELVRVLDDAMVLAAGAPIEEAHLPGGLQRAPRLEATLDRSGAECLPI